MWTSQHISGYNQKFILANSSLNVRSYGFHLEPNGLSGIFPSRLRNSGFGGKCKNKELKKEMQMQEAVEKMGIWPNKEKLKKKGARLYKPW